MRNRILALGVVLPLAACGGSHGGTDQDGGHDMGIEVTPDPADLDLQQGGPPAQVSFTATAHLPTGDMNVTSQSTWTIDDAGLGTLAGGQFTSGTMRGGTTLVHASYVSGGDTLFGSATLNVKFHAGTTVGCPGCPVFPGDGAPMCTTPSSAPTIVYPPDGVLLPPNMNVIDVHFMPGDGNTVFEIDFQNAATDVRVETVCTPVTNTRGSPTGGCAYSLDPTVWGWVADSNRGGNPLTITVRGAPADVSCVSKSDTRDVLFAEEDLNGGIYYWQSVVQGGIAGKTGGIFRKDFGDPLSTSEPFLTPGSTNKCVGCHFLSRDGLRMTFGSDDADSDDEYGDLHTNLYDVEMRANIASGIEPGFQAFSPDHLRFIAGQGKTEPDPPFFAQYDGDSGMGLADVVFQDLPGQRITQPDWTKDGTTIYFTVPANILTNFGSYNRPDDLHFQGGSILAASIDAAGVPGPAMPIITSAGPDENNYYPAVSPDGRFLIFNRAVGTTLEAHDDFNNREAKLFALSLMGGTPVDMAKANYKDGMTNSWPRWSPFIQMYKGKRLLWVTFSSTRDYGLAVQNENPPDGPLMNCYPPESPENPDGDHDDPFPPNCTQPQIWMAAISLSDLEFSGIDPSFPAFWLPFQDVTAHNHIAQWTEQVVGPPPGTCATVGMMCSMTNPCCEGLVCDVDGTCATIIP